MRMAELSAGERVEYTSSESDWSYGEVATEWLEAEVREGEWSGDREVTVEAASGRCVPSNSNRARRGVQQHVDSDGGVTREFTSDLWLERLKDLLLAVVVAREPHVALILTLYIILPTPK